MREDVDSVTARLLDLNNCLFAASRQKGIAYILTTAIILTY